jgi:hypothetical protein
MAVVIRPYVRKRPKLRPGGFATNDSESDGKPDFQSLKINPYPYAYIA